jgi:hypothetical protein
MTEPPQNLSWQVFGQNRDAITLLVSKMVSPAAAGYARKNLRLGAIYERSSGEIIAEVFRTPWGPVVVMATAGAGDESEHVTDVGRGRDVAPLTGEPDQQFLIRARSRSYMVTGDNLSRKFYQGDALVIK